MRRITSYRMTATADGTGAGTATTSTDQSVPRGKLIAVEVDYPAATVALTLTTTNLVSQTLLNLSAANTDTVLYPRTIAQTNAGVSKTYDGTRTIPVEFIVFGPLTLTLASGTLGQSVTVIAYIEEQ